MKISLLIETLNRISSIHGDIECQMQDEPIENNRIRDYPDFFVVEEKYEDGWFVNFRTWPY